ncbi:unnamed protein product, partial [Didymodactylos carnosus]
YASSYKSYRSSATSPSPSVHSWHHTVCNGGNTLSLMPHRSATTLPTLMTIALHQRHKYEPGIERVSKTSKWYKPVEFITKGERI